MKKRLSGLILTVLTVVTFAMDAHGEEPSTSTLGEETQEAKPSAPPGLLMSTLGKAGLAEPLDKAGTNIYGYIEGGYMHDFSSSGRYSGPTFILFNSLRFVLPTPSGKCFCPWSGLFCWLSQSSC